ncbi:hypothetical protein EVAR_62134_1 [Eumeta japonica]|uniref:Uncharacterized protein n=1 Tax=Eumeta variegata TaxID=151549 RepID=A0A4C1ZJL4_EUMVA|nr:hypothetical protein EVAR_62134_1 [Eumeta japonica]
MTCKWTSRQDKSDKGLQQSAPRIRRRKWPSRWRRAGRLPTIRKGSVTKNMQCTILGRRLRDAEESMTVVRRALITKLPLTVSIVAPAPLPVRALCCSRVPSHNVLL